MPELINLFEMNHRKSQTKRPHHSHTLHNGPEPLRPFDKLDKPQVLPLIGGSQATIGGPEDSSNYIFVIRHEFSSLSEALWKTPAEEFLPFISQDTKYVFLSAGRCLSNMMTSSCVDNESRDTEELRARLRGETLGKRLRENGDHLPMYAEGYVDSLVEKSNVTDIKDTERPFHNFGVRAKKDMLENLYFVDSKKMLLGNGYLTKRVILHPDWAVEFGMVHLHGLPKKVDGHMAKFLHKWDAGEAAPMYSCSNETSVDSLIDRLPDRLKFKNIGFACNSSGFPDLKGKLAVINRGECAFETKLKAAAGAGAAAALVVTTKDQPVSELSFSDTLCSIPAFMVSPEVGEVLRKSEHVNDVFVSLSKAERPPLNFIIDYRQRVRELGHMRYPSLSETVPTSRSLSHEKKLDRRVASIKAAAKDDQVVTVEVFDNKYTNWSISETVRAPGTLTEFPRLIVDLKLDCPNRERLSCGRWDRVVSLYSQMSSNKDSSREIARFVTGYRSRGRYLVDASTMLPSLLTSNSKHNIDLTLATEASWASISHNATLKLHFLRGESAARVADFAYQGKSNSISVQHPIHALPMFGGGNFEGFNDPNKHMRRARLVILPEGCNNHHVAFAVEREQSNVFNSRKGRKNVKPVVYTVNNGGSIGNISFTVLTTGHGWGKDEANCAEYCKSENTYTFDVTLVGPIENGKRKTLHKYTTVRQQKFPTAGSDMGCAAREDVAPNQYGTWHEGRAGWCPGSCVAPVTYFLDFPPVLRRSLRGVGNDSITTGHEVWIDITYRSTYKGKDYTPKPAGKEENDLGFPAMINHVSYMTIWSSPEAEGTPSLVFSSYPDPLTQKFTTLYQPPAYSSPLLTWEVRRKKRDTQKKLRP
uniref:Peptide-N-glycosidase F N-terminal domain-containing protein n=1 Tax=Amorphochlora amoebiformis TaxID=1561963 RepID=A0A7S0DK07_9EUKA